MAHIMTNFDKTRIFIFDFKIYPFLKSDDKVKIIKKIGKTQILLILILSEMKILNIEQKFKLEMNIVNILLNENRINNKTYEK